MLPAAGSGERARKMAAGFLTSFSPLALMAKKPSSFTAPKRFFGGTHDAIAAAGFAFEIQDGVHQVLEQARACDRASLVTWPTMMTAVPLDLA